MNLSECRARGLKAYTNTDFESTTYEQSGCNITKQYSFPFLILQEVFFNTMSSSTSGKRLVKLIAFPNIPSRFIQTPDSPKC